MTACSFQFLAGGATPNIAESHPTTETWPREKPPGEADAELACGGEGDDVQAESSSMPTIPGASLTLVGKTPTSLKPGADGLPPTPLILSSVGSARAKRADLARVASSYLMDA